MLFNSFEFLAFLPTVFILYWFIFNRNILVQNLFLLIASYIFYGWWDSRFLLLIALSTIIDYTIGLLIYRTENYKRRKFLVTISIIANLGILGFFKYFNFFIDSWQQILKTIGFSAESTYTLNIILPVGISFYTFQTMSYTIDIYRKQLVPTKDFISFATFVSFFPQLVAGPIERASNLLPQILKKRVFTYDNGVQGMRLILWGMFKKVVIADSIAPYVNEIFWNYDKYSGGELMLGAICFSFQLYSDFSGYSDIAIGTSKLFGFELMSNFRFPIFTRDLVQVWSRWHISLTKWFKDYVFNSLGGLKASKPRIILNVFLVFLASGLWHGANWKYAVWGGVLAILFLLTLVIRKKIKIRCTSRAQLNLLNLFKILLSLLIITQTFVLFRSENLEVAFTIYKKIFQDILSFKLLEGFHFDRSMIFIVILIGFDYLFRKDERNLFQFGRTGRLISYLIMIWGIIAFFKNQGEFLYFQF